jgi:predicted  nucleic acid-binding Zn-ribbon protein
MNEVDRQRLEARGKPPAPTSSDEVRALLELAAFDDGIAKQEASVARALAVLERARGELAQITPALKVDREELLRLEEVGATVPDVERLRRAVREKERRAALLMRQAEEKQSEALGASANLRDACADLAERRRALTDRLSGTLLTSYETALRLGGQPVAIGTRGAVCWGCFRRLPLAVTANFQRFRRPTPCPHCRRLLYDPSWLETR